MKIIILIACLLIISGCSQGVYNQKNYLVGIEGLEMEFQKTNKEEVYEKEEFGIVMFIKNKGAADITSQNPAVLKIDYDEYRLFLSSTSRKVTSIDNLFGKSQTNPIGSEEPFESYFKTNLLTKNREGAKTKINYNLCYPYKTEITTMTCIDTKFAVRDESAAACQSTPYSGSGGQGAPIVITKIEPEIQLQSNYVRPQFKIYVSNFGRGYVTSADSCISGSGNIGADITDASQVGYVNVEAWVSGTKLTCGTETNNGRLRIADSESYIKCYMPEGIVGYSREQKNYLTPLTVRVTYTYTNIIEKEIEIKRDETIPSSERNLLDTLYADESACNSYEVFDGRKCISKCEYCARNPGDGICNNNIPFEDFRFKSNFQCACDLTKCNELSGKGECIKGYCPGTSYCCAANPCPSWQVWDDNTRQCINRCEYCSQNPTSSSCIEINSILTQNSNVKPYFSCLSLSYDKLNQMRSDGDFVIISNYCDESKGNYCVSDLYDTPGITTSGSTATTSTTDNYGGVITVIGLEDKNVVSSSQNFCSFCADNGECSFENNEISAKITKDFSCSCDLNDKNNLPVYSFVPDNNYCNNGKYCCDIPG